MARLRVWIETMIARKLSTENLGLFGEIARHVAVAFDDVDHFEVVASVSKKDDVRLEGAATNFGP
jgi:hypothetical protein